MAHGNHHRGGPRARRELHFANGRVDRQRSPLEADPSYAVAERQVIFGRRERTTSIVRRDDLVPGARVPGPAVIVEQTATTVIPPGSTARVDEVGTLVIEIGEES